MIQLYAKRRGGDTFRPFVIGYSETKYESDYAGLNFYRSLGRGSFSSLKASEVPTNLTQLLIDEFNITDLSNDYYTQNFDILDNTIFDFYETTDESSKLGFSFKIKGKNATTTPVFFFGDLDNSSIFRIANTNFLNTNIFFLTYNNITSIDALVQSTLSIEGLNDFKEYNMSYPTTAPIFAYTTSYGAIQSIRPGTNDPYDLFTEILNLRHGINWFKFFTGKYYKGQPYFLELKEPKNGYTKIDFSYSVGLTQYDDGYTTSYEPNYGDRTSFLYFQNGTDILNLFDYDSDYDEILLKNGCKIIYNKNSDNTATISLMYDNRGITLDYFFNIKNQLVDLNDHYGYLMRGYFNLFIGIPNSYLTSTPKQWLSLIDTNYSKWEYNNCPIYFTSYFSYPIRYNASDYYSNVRNRTIFDINYESYPNLITNGYISNAYAYVNDNNSFGYPTGHLLETTPIDYSFWEQFILGVSSPQKGPNIGSGSIGGGYSQSGGGTGSFDDTTETIKITDLSRPEKTSNFIGHYLLNLQNLIGVSDCLSNANSSLFSTGILQTEYITSLRFLKIPKKININNFIYSQNELLNIDALAPVTYASEASTSGIKTKYSKINIGGSYTNLYNFPGGKYKTPPCGFLFKNSLISGDLGDYEIKEYFGNYLDYAPYTKIQIFLPFVGYVEIDTNRYMNKKALLKYIINIDTGQVIYLLGVEEEGEFNYIDIFNGLCTNTISLTSKDNENRRIAIEQAVLAITKPTEAAQNLFNATRQRTPITTTQATPPDASFYGVMYPFIQITRPKVSIPETYAHEYGYPCNMSSILGDLNGFTKVDTMHLKSIKYATSEEVSEIEDLLREGVIIN